jgi:exonuclease III
VHAYLNINCLRYKVGHIQELLQKGSVDILFFTETKLDQFFVDCQFKVDNYILWRQDRTSKGGGIAVYLRSGIAGDRKRTFESVESISVETIMDKK